MSPVLARAELKMEENELSIRELQERASRIIAIESNTSLETYWKYDLILRYLDAERLLEDPQGGI